jgi:lipoyl synthase
VAEGAQALGGAAGHKPEWLKKPLPEAKSLAKMKGLLRARNLHTVCESALCPNLGTCFGHGTATFLIMGDVCTRGCRFCGVDTGSPLELDTDEPENVADAAAALGLRHVVITSVTRDDLPDGGAAHYVATIEAVRERLPKATVEVLVPDFGGSRESADLVIAATPEVFNHNLETVPRLYSAVRPQADYERSLGLLRQGAQQGRSAVKTGLMVGVGETESEITEVLRAAAEAGVSIVTIGQYLSPTRNGLAVVEYVGPEVFARYKAIGAALGMLVHAAPFVRSSFQAGEMFAEARTRSTENRAVASYNSSNPRRITE